MVNAFLFPTLCPPPSFSFSHQANYISVSIETCLLNALSYPPLLFSVPSLFSASTCFLFFPSSPATSSIFSLHSAPFTVCGAAAPSFGSNGFLLFTKRTDVNQSEIDHCAASGLLWLPRYIQAETPKSLLKLSIIIDSISGPRWILLRDGCNPLASISSPHIREATLFRSAELRRLAFVLKLRLFH